MPELVWPAILVALLAGLVASSIPFLMTFDPNRPEGKLALLASELGALRDLTATARLTWEGTGEELVVRAAWLAPERALRVEVLAPRELAGQVFTYQGGQINHFLPARDDIPAGVVILSVGDILEGEGVGPFSPQELITAIRLGTLKVREERGEGEDILEVSGRFPGLPLLRGLVLSFSQAQGPLSLGDLAGVTISLGGRTPRVLKITLDEVRINQGITLHEIRSFPQPYQWILPRQED
jgi:hypothetical protein